MTTTYRTFDGDEAELNLDEHGQPFPRAGEGQEPCGHGIDACRGVCCLVRGHPGRHECSADDPGKPGTCPA